MQNKYIYCPTCKNSLSEKEIEGDKVKVCDKCGFTFWDNPKPAVSIIIYKENKVLMLQRARDPFKNYWVLPGGYVKSEETSKEAIVREAKEETGLEIKSLEILGDYGGYYDPRGFHLDIIYTSRSQGEVQISSEDKKWAYFALGELPQNIAYNHRRAILDWAEKYSKK